MLDYQYYIHNIEDKQQCNLSSYLSSYNKSIAHIHPHFTYKQHVSPYLEEKTSPLASQKRTPRRLAWRSLPAWEKLLLLITARESQSSAIFPPQKNFSLWSSHFSGIWGPGTHVFFFESNWPWYKKSAVRCFSLWPPWFLVWPKRSDRCGVQRARMLRWITTVSPWWQFLPWDGWMGCFIDNFFCCKFEGWRSSLVLFTIGDITRGIP